MAQLATDLLRTVARAFYQTEQVLVLEALIIHSTLSDKDLGHLLGMNNKSLHKVCGRLREDDLISVQIRSERRADGTGSYLQPSVNGAAPKERFTNSQWYYINYHRAIDSIKYRMHKLNKYVESLGAPTSEKKDLHCPRCKAQWTELEVMDNIDMDTGSFLCGRCQFPLNAVEEDEGAENEMMKRLNVELDGVLSLMRKIDQSQVPENSWDDALKNYKPIHRSEAHQGPKVEVLDLPKNNLQSSRGLEIKPEKIAVTLQNDEDVKRANKEAEEQAKREKEARQNALPDWIAKSTVTGDITAVGAKEERERRAREAHAGDAVKAEDEGEKKPAVGGDEDVMAQYWAELEKSSKQQEAADAAEEEEEEEGDDDEDEFKDVGISSSAHPASTNGANGTGANTPQMESSNATDDERDQKRVKLETTSGGTDVRHANGEVVLDGVSEKVAQDTPAASDEDDDDELEFENI
ncbi:hypothetical protein EJ03DRAFT_329960 [Teratosphaeria nubilosa]|uniref:HTH TFE/IIEalpha-type domain-containing protein n=1 Tax=Teratosphaeria nubilosa TaxID=161662 RepID=A0A6G1L1X0_9PEZI|nr:hypothetical protein EJ03DRAFT_329960 [Teratosphaeria nubilosa]